MTDMYTKDMKLTGTFTIITPPPPVGYWILDPNPTGSCMRFSMQRKPTDAQIKATEETFGWKWEDNK